jgi:hypothetical protein
VKGNMTQKKKQRKPSWVYHDLAWKIQVPTQSAKLVLTFLAKQANDSGKSYAGYAYMQRCCVIGSDTTVSKALQYLRDVLGILSWQKGGQGHESDTNKYTLNLTAMKQIVKTQRIFDPETGKLIRPSPTIGLGDSEPTPASGDGVDDQPTPVDEVTDSSWQGNRLQFASNRLQPVETNPLVKQLSTNQPSARQPLGALADKFGDEVCLDVVEDSTDSRHDTPTPSAPPRQPSGCNIREVGDPFVATSRGRAVREAREADHSFEVDTCSCCHIKAAQQGVLCKSCDEKCTDKCEMQEMFLQQHFSRTCPSKPLAGTTFESIAKLEAFLDSIADDPRWKDCEYVVHRLPNGLNGAFVKMVPSYIGTQFVGYIPQSQRAKNVKSGDHYVCRYGECDRRAEEFSLYCSDHKYGCAAGLIGVQSDERGSNVQ